MISNSHRSSHIASKTAFAFVAIISLFATGSVAQKNGGADDSPVFREYRGIQIGMTAEETRKKLGNPKDKADDQDFYIFDELEQAQIIYDKTHKVSVLSVDYMSGAKTIPTAKAVIGSDIEAKSDGSMYKMIRYTKAGFWVSYSRTSGESGMVSITIQKID